MFTKILLLCIFLVHSVYAYIYNDLLVKTQATIFPKIILLDQNLSHKLQDGTIVFAIVYEKDDLYMAQSIKKMMEKSYDHLLDGYPFQIELLEASQIGEITKKVTAFYVLHLCEQAIVEVSKVASSKHIITFSYDLDNLRKGLLFSVAMEQSPTFYINKKNLYAENVNFVPPLLQMVTFIDRN